MSRTTYAEQKEVKTVGDNRGSVFEDVKRLLDHEFQEFELAEISGLLHGLTREEVHEACANLRDVLDALTTWVREDSEEDNKRD